MFLVDNEITLRLVFFFGIFLLMAAWEAGAPRRRLNVPKGLRWRNNLALVVINSILLRLLFPAASVGVAIYISQQGWGLFNAYPMPQVLSVALSVVLLDCAIYLQHVMFHAVPLLWRIHRVHHADLDYDVTTGLRFHPLEIVLSMLIKFAAISLLGAPVAAVIIFEILLNGSSMFNHGNVSLPAKIDRYLRWFLVTPDMHRVHHSVEYDESNSNFGFSLSWWDRLFGTYKKQPRAGHLGMTIGLAEFRDNRLAVNLPGMLRLPFTGAAVSPAINRKRTEDHE